MVFEIGTLRLELIEAQESEAVWKTEADKADQRRLEAEAEVERLEAQLKRAIEIAEKIWADCSNGSEHTELAELKGEIK
jgi:hypothetical protein